MTYLADLCRRAEYEADRTGVEESGRSAASWGRYRAIDFQLSNMVNSGIRNIGVVAEKNYHSLMDHLGSGKEWDLNRKNDGLFILPPFDYGGKQRKFSRSVRRR